MITVTYVQEENKDVRVSFPFVTFLLGAEYLTEVSRKDFVKDTQLCLDFIDLNWRHNGEIRSKKKLCFYIYMQQSHNQSYGKKACTALDQRGRA